MIWPMTWTLVDCVNLWKEIDVAEKGNEKGKRRNFIENSSETQKGRERMNSARLKGPKPGPPPPRAKVGELRRMLAWIQR
jgi:hypothetical protein